MGGIILREDEKGTSRTRGYSPELQGIRPARIPSPKLYCVSLHPFLNPGLRFPPVLKAEHLDHNSQAIHESSLYGQKHVHFSRSKQLRRKRLDKHCNV